MVVVLDKVLPAPGARSEEHTSELQSRKHLVCRLLLEKKKRPPMRRPDDVHMVIWTSIALEQWDVALPTPRDATPRRQAQSLPQDVPTGGEERRWSGRR